MTHRLFYSFVFVLAFGTLLLLTPAKNTTPPPVSPSPKKVLFVVQIYANTEVNHMLDVADRLKARGHTCEFLMIEPFRSKVEKRGFTFQGFPLETGNQLADATTNFSRASNEAEYIKAFVALPAIVAKSYEPALLVLKERIERDPPHVLYTSMFSDYAIDLAAHYDIPLAIDYAVQLGSMYSYEDQPAAPNTFLWESINDHTRLTKRINKILTLVKVIFGTMDVSAATNAIRAKHGLQTYSAPLTNWMRAAVIVSWPLSLDVARTLRPLTFMVGFISEPYDPQEKLEPKDQELKNYLDSKSGGVVYCSLGSLAAPKQNDFDELMKAFDKWIQIDPANRGAIVAMNEFAKSQIDTSSFPSSVQIHGWVHQKLILAHPHTSVYVTHAGQGSIAEAVVSRTPMLAIPQFGDQMTNAYRIEEAGIALKIHFREEEITAQNVLDKLVRLSTDTSFQQALDKHYQINYRCGGAGKAADIVEDLMLFGNLDHLIPITEKVPFPANYNADIYAIAAASLFLVLYIGFAILRAITRGIMRLSKSAPKKKSKSE